MGFIKRRKRPELFRPHAVQIENGERKAGAPGMVGVNEANPTERLASVSRELHGDVPPAPAPVAPKAPARAKSRSKVAKPRGKSVARILPLLACALLSLPMLGGCATVADHARAAVHGYCTLSTEQRSVIRASVAAAVYPNSIRVDCAADAADLIIVPGEGASPADVF